MTEQNDLHLKYRPSKLEEVVGQNSAVVALYSLLEDVPPHTILLTGPSGVGKTTMARIYANAVGTELHNLYEVDAATNTGIDAMRALRERLAFKGLGKNTTKTIIVDEAHRLSVQAWDSLLKDIEEPPDHVYWIFCTTNVSKVPDTIRSRCVSLTLGGIDTDTIYDYLFSVVESEQLDVPEDVVGLVADGANGSMRKALVNLQLVTHCETRKEAKALLQQTSADDVDIAKLCRVLMDAPSWDKLTPIMRNLLEHASAESIRISICNYMAAVCLNSKGDDKATHMLTILSAFRGPYNDSDGKAPLLLSIAQVIYG
jgi:DNA polymerase III gamma/tau subunit